MAFYLPYLLIPASILGIIWLNYKACQTRYSLKGSKIRFRRLLLIGVIFTLSIVLSGLFDVLKDSKRVSRNILLGDITQKYEAVYDKKRKEQVSAQKMEEFTTCYEGVNNIFVDRGERLTDRNMKKLIRFYQNLPEKQQKEVQEKYERVKKDVQYFKDTQTEEACCNLFSDTVPFSTSEQEWKERQQSVAYEHYETLLQRTTNIQNPTRKKTTLNYLENVKEWLGQQRQN